MILARVMIGFHRMISYNKPWWAPARFIHSRYCNYFNLLNNNCKRVHHFIYAIILKHFLEIKNIPNLTRYGNTLSIFRPHYSIVPNRIIRIWKILTPHQITANHDSCASFSCFAMNSCYIFDIPTQPILQILAESNY